MIYWLRDSYISGKNKLSLRNRKIIFFCLRNRYVFLLAYFCFITEIRDTFKFNEKTKIKNSIFGLCFDVKIKSSNSMLNF